MWRDALWANHAPHGKRDSVFVASCRASYRDGSGNVEDITKFLDMGGYAAFVWPALGVAAFILTAMAVASMRGLRASEIALHKAEAQAPQRRSRAGHREPEA